MSQMAQNRKVRRPRNFVPAVFLFFCSSVFVFDVSAITTRGVRTRYTPFLSSGQRSMYLPPAGPLSYCMRVSGCRSSFRET